MSYKNYCNRRTARKGQEPNDIPCCPWKIPVIGPILFSLFIFSPFFLPTSHDDKNPEVTSGSTIHEPHLPKDQYPPTLEVSDKVLPLSLHE